MKERLTQQLLDAYLRAYLEKKELWSAHKLEVAKATHNLWHTGTQDPKNFGEAKACCM
jgi:hypothetical protein